MSTTAGNRSGFNRSNSGSTAGAIKLCQPALAPAIVLAVTERFTPASRNAQIEFLDVFVFGQRFGIAVHHNAAVFQNVAIAGEAQRHVGVLLGQQERYAFLLVK